MTGLSAWGGDQTRYFFELTPDHVLADVEASGLLTTGRCMALNSFENRVYDVELELDGVKPLHPSDARRIAKFYRPGRWSREQILEEHQFLEDLRDAEIPAIAPIPFPGGGTLRQSSASGILYSLFPKVGGRAPDELTGEQLRWLGRLLGRIHAVGKSRAAPHRVRLGAKSYGSENLDYLLKNQAIPLEFRDRYTETVNLICENVERLMDGVEIHRIHGDCHLGNLLWNPSGPFFLDFDDMLNGPAVQDIWLLVPGRDAEAKAQLDELLEGYEEMTPFDRTSLALIEPLRALRFVHYTAWIARRWDDPAFPLAFPQFGSHRYWSDMTSDLEEQLRWIQK